jgi:hypothetical protein
VLHYFPPSVDAHIREAIAGKHLLQLRYKNHNRVVEPHDYGVQHGVQRLLVYQLNSTGTTGSHSVGWRLFDIAKIESLSVLEAKFKGSRRAAHEDHHTWDVVYARVAQG